MPVQIWAYPLVWQFISDTLPEMIFASAWTLLVSFFVQLVGVAAGSGPSTSPGTVIQITAYIVYITLLGAFFVNNVASVLLYALLCCIYAALFGTCVYFCPRLLLLLKPSLSRYSGLGIRLAICSVLCILVFLSHTIGYAMNIVAPPWQVYWWWNYGALELIPSALFLLLMHPSPATRNSATGTPNQQQPSTGKILNVGMRRTPSGSAAASARRPGENTPLLLPPSPGLIPSSWNVSSTWMAAKVALPFGCFHRIKPTNLLLVPLWQTDNILQQGTNAAMQWFGS